ncbi:MAG: gliding motility lipoprotein GldH [Bacteroidales bacterium]|nr:gliding motility lipoprotein GldH [Bacteroidales bacterium]
MTLKTETKNLFLLFLLVMVMISCDQNRVIDENIALEKATWNVNNKLQFDVAISDLLLRYNVYLNVRNGPEYPFSNLFLFMNTIFPNGHISCDTIELTLADYDGRWLGSGMGSVKFSRFLLQKDVRFKQTGKYRFILEQAMRVNELNGIHDIGLRIEKQ